jgi:hypothetical protein
MRGYRDQPTTADSPFDLLELDLPPPPPAPLTFDGAPVTPAEAAAIVMGTEPPAPAPLDEAAVAALLAARTERCDPNCLGWFVSNDDEPTVQACDECNRANAGLELFDEDALQAPGAKDELARAIAQALALSDESLRRDVEVAVASAMGLPAWTISPVVTPPATLVVSPPAPRGPNGECGCAPQTRPLAENGVCPACTGWRPLPAGFGRVRAAEPAQVETRATAQPGAAGGQTEAGRALTALAAGELVAGAAAEGHGVLVSWSGRGEITRGALMAILSAADALDWAPAARSGHAHAARAVASLGNAYVVRASPVPVGESTRRTRTGQLVGVPLSPEARGWSARWTIGSIAGEGAVGDAYGRISMVAELAPDGTTLTVSPPGDMADAVVAEYRRLAADEIMGASDVTAWLRGRMHAAGAVRLGGSWYVPTAARPVVERVVTGLAEAWGTDWMAPPLPVATSDQLRAGLARGLAEEVDDLLAELADARRLARERGAADLGAKAAATFLQRLRSAADRSIAYATTLGEAHVATLRAKARAALDEITPLLDASAARGAMLELT